MDTEIKKQDAENTGKSKNIRRAAAIGAGLSVAAAGGVIIGRATNNSDDAEQAGQDELMAQADTAAVTPDEATETAELQGEENADAPRDERTAADNLHEQDHESDRHAKGNKEEKHEEKHEEKPKEDNPKEDEPKPKPHDGEEGIDPDDVDPNAGIAPIPPADQLTAEGYHIITDIDGNKIEAMIFSDGNGNVWALADDDNDGVFDVFVDPETGREYALPEAASYTRADYDIMLHDDGGYRKPDPNENLWTDNDEINKDIIITDKDTPESNDKDAPKGDDDKLLADNPRTTDIDPDDIPADGENGENITGDDIPADDVTADEELVAQFTDDEELVADIVIEEDDDEIYDPSADDVVRQLLGDDDTADVNEELVAYVDNTPDLTPELEIYDNDIYDVDDSSDFDDSDFDGNDF